MGFHQSSGDHHAGEWVQIGSCRVDLRSGLVRGPAGETLLTRKARLVLAHLIAHPGVLLTREELLNAVWGPNPPGDDVLSHAIRQIRLALGDNPKLPGLIETIPKSGYRMLAFANAADAATSTPLPDGAQPYVADPSARRHAPPSRWVGGLAAAGSVLLVTVIALVTARPEPPLEVQVQDRLLLTFDERIERNPRLSPDGRYIAYSARERTAGRERIFVRSVGGDSEVVLARGAADEGYDESWPVWFPDGTQIAFLRHFDDRCSMLATGALGGAERLLTPCPTFIRERFDLIDADTMLRTIRKRGPTDTARIFRVEMDAPQHRLVDIPYAGAAGMHDSDPRISPDGAKIAFVRGYPASSLLVVPQEGGPVRTLTSAPVFLRGHAWMADSRHLIVSADFGGGSRLHVVDSETQRWADTGLVDAESPTAAREGDLIAYARRQLRLTMWQVPLEDATLPLEPVAPSTRSDVGFAYGPVANTFAFASNRSGAWMIWYVGPGGGPPKPITRAWQHRIGDLSFGDDGVLLNFTEYDADETRTWSVDPARGSSTETLVARGTRSALGVGGRLIANVARDDGHVLAEFDASGRLVRALDDGPAASVPQIAETGRILYARPNEDGLWSIALDTGLRQAFAPVPSLFFSHAWAWRHGALWYFHRIEDRIVLMRWSPEDGTRAVRRLPEETFGGLLAVDPEGRHATIAVIADEESDLATARVTVGPETRPAGNR